MKLTKKYAVEFEAFHKYNLDNKINKEVFEFHIFKHKVGHRDFMISLVIWDYLIFMVDFYNMRERYT